MRVILHRTLRNQPLASRTESVKSERDGLTRGDWLEAGIRKMKEWRGAVHSLPQWGTVINILRILSDGIDLIVVTG